MQQITIDTFTYKCLIFPGLWGNSKTPKLAWQKSLLDKKLENHNFSIKKPWLWKGKTIARTRFLVSLHSFSRFNKKITANIILTFFKSVVFHFVFCCNLWFWNAVDFANTWSLGFFCVKNFKFWIWIFELKIHDFREFLITKLPN